MFQGGKGRANPPRLHNDIAQRTLRMQVEVKRSSSLPTAMFDACDPMLEAKLAEATEGLFAVLLNLGPPADLGPPTEELPIECVSQEELATLGNRIGPHPGQPTPIGTGTPEELLGVLVDLCHSADPADSQRAAVMLCRHLDVTLVELDQLRSDLEQQLQERFRVDSESATAVNEVAVSLAPLLHRNLKPEDGAS